MAATTLTYLTISNVSEQLFKGEVASVSVPGIDGEMTLLAHHEPLVTLLMRGTVRVDTGTDEPKKEFLVDGGMVEVSRNTITILV